MSKILFSVLFVIMIALLFLHLRDKIQKKLLAERAQ